MDSNTLGPVPLAEISEKRDVSGAVFLIGGSHLLQAEYHRADYDFKYENIKIGVPLNVLFVK